MQPLIGRVDEQRILHIKKSSLKAELIAVLGRRRDQLEADIIGHHIGDVDLGHDAIVHADTLAGDRGQDAAGCLVRRDIFPLYLNCCFYETFLFEYMVRHNALSKRKLFVLLPATVP